MHGFLRLSLLEQAGRSRQPARPESTDRVIGASPDPVATALVDHHDGVFDWLTASANVRPRLPPGRMARTERVGDGSGTGDIGGYRTSLCR